MGCHGALWQISARSKRVAFLTASLTPARDPFYEGVYRAECRPDRLAIAKKARGLAIYPPPPGRLNLAALRSG